MTLNDLERRNSPYFAFFTEFDIFAGQLGSTSQWLKIDLVRKNIVSQFVFHFWPKLTTLQRGLSAIAELLKKL